MTRCGIVQQSGDELNLLLHAFGELFDFLVLPVGDLQAFAPFQRAFARLVLGEIAQAAEEDQVVENLHAFVEPALFGKVADVIQLLAVEGLAEEANLTFIRHSDADHHADGGGFAGAVGAEQAVDAAFANGQRKIIDGDEVVEGFADTPQFYRVGHERQFRVSRFELQVYARRRGILETVSLEI